MDDLLQHFVVEARELTQQATDDLLNLEREPSVAAHLDSAFRAVHTLKGSVGLFDFAPMGLALHAAEDLLGALKGARARIEIDADVIDLLLDCVGQTERWIAAIEQTGLLPPDAADEGYRLARALRSQLDGEAAPDGPAISDADGGWIEDLLAAGSRRADPLQNSVPRTAIRYTPRADCFFAGDDPLALLRSVPDLVHVRATYQAPWPPEAEIDPFACNLRLEALSTAGYEAVKAVFRFVPDQVVIFDVTGRDTAGGAEAGRDGSATREGRSAVAGSSRTLRVDAARVDRLADLVGEMVIAKNELAHVAAMSDGAGAREDLVRSVAACQATIDRLVADMHRAVMDVRMMSMREIFRRFPRAVRESAGQLGTLVEFSIEGEDVEADKSVTEGLSEPLLHVLRNAVAHGGEPEAVRLGAGKPAEVRIVLRARRDGDRLVVEVSDDGRGIDPELVRRAAHERGVAPADRIETMSDAEVTDLIFAPGFSTASDVTDLSGRGVGMDAVRSAVERLGGQVAVQSRPGHGTTIRFSLPLSVVMTKVMTVHVGSETYGIPIEGVLETAYLPASRIIPIQGAEAFVLRDRTIPLVRLTDLLRIPRGRDGEGGTKVLVMWVGGERVGIAVDGFGGRLDILMRPMAGLLAGLPGVIGTTLMGDGSVLMILDIPELIG
ncbi:chemotaxis protein CheA [Microvirga terrae]|uniref:histidine kinase n=1 Tax=Microvirga terrae TaxID=2740529 RepID=A0ABY5RMH2_9HYPH|nr:chemotaxis protein CheA [Microvirga terrae]UVF17586.1 chemotaxis protein CheA [Microvirga terrae]